MSKRTRAVRPLPAVAAALLFSIAGAGQPAAQGTGAQAASSASAPSSGTGVGAPEKKTRSFEIGPLTIDRIFPSMEGPSQRIRFDYRGMDWVTGFDTVVVDAESGESMGEEFFCHSQMQLDNTIRLVVTATGMSTVRFPEGFGLPLTQIVRAIPLDWRGVTLLGMVLNNHDTSMNRDVNIRFDIEYLDFPEDLPPPGLKKLYHVALPMTVVDLNDAPSPENHEDTCMAELVEGMTQHWMVPPGEQVSRKIYKDFLPVDATVHHAVVHMHNHGAYMQIRDVTTDTVLWRTDVEYEKNRVQIQRIPQYSSQEGFPIYRDHEYEIEALYRNATDAPVDAMAMMYLFYHPKGNVNITFPEPPPMSATGP